MYMSHRFRKFLAGGLAALMLVSLLPTALAAEGDTTITILGTSDTHGNVWGYSYEDNKENAGSLAQIATYVKQVRAESDNVILVDDGDTIQGTIMTDDLYNVDPKKAHPVIAAMNEMKYDAMGLGNHEFNWGVTSMNKILGQAEFPVLCANIKNGKGELVTGEGWTIVERSGVKVALIGVDTPNIQRWDGGKDGIDDLKIASLADGVAEAIQEIGDKADVFVVMAHAGYEGEYSTDGSDAAKTILEKCPEVTVLQVGHTHVKYTNTDNAVQAVGGTNSGATQVVRFDVTVDKDKKVTAATAEIVDVKELDYDQDIRDVKAVKEAHEATIQFVTGDVLGHASAKFQPENEIKGIPAGRIMDTAVMDLIGKVQLEYSGADVTGAALFKDTSDLPEGDLNYGNIFDIYKYANTLKTVKITGAELKAYMEWAAECYNTWVPGDVTISFNPAKAGYLHDHFTGVEYEIDLSKPAGERIVNLTFKGEPVTEETALTLCVNDYRFSGLKTAGIIHGEAEWESSQSVRDMLKEYMGKNDPLDPAKILDNNWKIVGVDLQEDSAERSAYIEKVNAGELATPYNKSINLNEANNVIVDGILNSADAGVSTTAQGKTSYYRLRDLAVVLKGTEAAFNVEWNGQVVITKGGEYTAAPLTGRGEPSRLEMADITVLVDGAPVEISAVLIGGNYYVSAEGLNALLGTSAAEAEGVMTLSAKNTAAAGIAG